MSKIDIIIERLKTAPPPPEVVDEIYALMEKIETSKAPPAGPKRGILDLIGALKDSKAFEGDPVEIQRRLRDEWN